jgi:2-polyprenyl-3-methyl-5-hydroxy-6-metoxy-1,4-benzoquinol methylase
MKENDRDIITHSKTLSWDYYLKTINSTDSFITRYYHYLRWKSVLQYIDFIFKNVKDDAKVALDIGCNGGYYSAKLGSLGLKVDAIDLNLKSYRLINNPNATYFEGDFLTWVPPRKYDLIMAFEVYEHIPPNERENFIQKIVNLLNPGGILLFSGPNCFSLYYGAGYVKDNIKQVFGYVDEVNWHYRIPYQHYSRIFASQNLEIITWHTNGVFPVYSNKLERILEILSTQLITDLDLTASKIFKGFGANYFAILKKSDTKIDTSDW